MVSRSSFVHESFATFTVAAATAAAMAAPPPPPWGATAGSTSTFDTCLSHPCFYVGHTDAMDTWATSNPPLLDREGLFLLWYTRLLHILGIRDPMHDIHRDAAARLLVGQPIPPSDAQRARTRTCGHLVSMRASHKLCMRTPRRAFVGRAL